MKDFQAAAQVPLAVVSGDADLGVTAFTAGFFNLAAKGGLKVVAAQSAERPGYQLNVIAVTNAAWDAGRAQREGSFRQARRRHHGRLLGALFAGDRGAQARRRHQEP